MKTIEGVYFKDKSLSHSLCLSYSEPLPRTLLNTCTQTHFGKNAIVQMHSDEPNLCVQQAVDYDMVVAGLKSASDQ